MIPYSEAWDRRPNTNVFVKRNDKNLKHEFKSGLPWPGGVCLGLSCTMRIF